MTAALGSTDADALERHVVTTRLAGRVTTTPASTLGNCAKLVAGHDRYTFGLSDWRRATLRDAVDAVRWMCGGDPGGSSDLDGPGWIDPAACLRGIAAHRDALAGLAHQGGRVLLATGHPTGLLPHYTAIARALQDAGCALLAPLDDRYVRDGDDGRRRVIRFLDGVACVADGGSLRHSHRSLYMEAMLDALADQRTTPDLVVGDHGMAGAAIERGLPTLSIADVNDPALLLAQLRGRTSGVLPIDDNLPPRVFVPVTTAMLAW